MIAHIDADAFFASALQRKFPRLKGKPLLALGMGGGCVIAASYEAKAFGVKTGMRLTDARKLCPRALAVPSDFSEALLASRQIEHILKNECPIVERMSVDEWFLELRSLQGGLPAHLRKWAEPIQESVGSRVGLTISIGIAPTTILSKMASEYRKPAGITVIDEKELSIEEFLRDRPAAAIPGIGSRRKLHSDAHGWKTAWDIANADSETVIHLFGRPGHELQQELLGKSVYSVEQDKSPPKSISRCRSFKGVTDRMLVFSNLLHHLTYTVLKMRRDNLACTQVSVWLRDGEYKHWGSDSKLPQLMDTEEQLFPYMSRCFDKLFEKNTRYTQVGLALFNLRPKGGAQYSLFEDTKRIDGSERVQTALDSLHEKFGREAVKRGSAVPTKGATKKGLYVVN